MRWQLRTFREIKPAKKVEQVIEKWAKNNGFRFSKSEDGTIECYRSGWLTTTPVMVQLTDQKGSLKLEAMLKVDFLSQLTTLFSAPPELALESGDGPLEYERLIARKFVNKLFNDLSLKPIE